LCWKFANTIQLYVFWINHIKFFLSLNGKTSQKPTKIALAICLIKVPINWKIIAAYLKGFERLSKIQKNDILLPGISSPFQRYRRLCIIQIRKLMTSSAVQPKRQNIEQRTSPKILKRCSSNPAPEMYTTKETKLHLLCCHHDNSFATGPVLINSLPSFCLNQGSSTPSNLMRRV